MTFQTYYADSRRSSEAEIQQELELLSNNPLIDSLMNSISGLFAVLNEYRQVLTVNQAFIDMLRIDNVTEIMGLRPGEIVQCIHAKKMPGGCGTSEFCATCGAAVSMVVCLGTNKAEERKCSITVNREGKHQDLFFIVRSCPIQLETRRFILLFLRDITQQQNWANLERVFFHDISNLIHGIMGRSEILPFEPEGERFKLSKEIFQLSLRLAQEVSIQRSLLKSGIGEYDPVKKAIEISDIFNELNLIFKNHPASQDKILVFPEDLIPRTFFSDYSLLIRILNNMITNALEASDNGEQIVIKFEERDDKLVFSVANNKYIPDHIALRIFQRNFSTKDELGRGLGTYSMRLFGENILGGKVHFTSSKKTGTVFYFEHPV